MATSNSESVYIPWSSQLWFYHYSINYSIVIPQLFHRQGLLKKHCELMCLLTMFAIKRLTSCGTSKAYYYHLWLTSITISYLLQAPALNNAGKQSLLWIVTYIWAKTKNNPMVVTIGKAHYWIFFHSWLKWLENFLERRMKQDLLKASKFFAIIVFSIRCR